MRNNYIKKTLKNGVKLYLYVDKSMKRVLVNYSINYGSSGKWFDFYYNDKLYHVLPGCAHFLEHMLGEHSKFGNIYELFSDRKYDKNGGTALNVTNYYFIGVDDIKDSIEKLIRAIDEPVFNSNDIEETKHAIVEETKRGANSKYAICRALAERNLFNNMDLYHESLVSIGNEETTNKLDYDMLKVCYDAFYYDENKTLLIAGNIDPDEMTNYVESIYETIEPHKCNMREYSYDLEGIKKETEVVNMATEDDVVSICFKEQKNKFTDKEAMYYAGFLLDSKFSSDVKFIEDLKKENIIAMMSSRYSASINDDYYEIFISADVKKTDIFLERLLEYIKVNDFKESDFKLYLKSEIASQAMDIDFKYSILQRFPFMKDVSDDFDDIEFIRTLTFDKFIEFYNTLSFDEYAVGIVRDKKDY